MFACTVFHNYIFFLAGFIRMCPAVSYNKLSALNKMTNTKMEMPAHCSCYGLAFVNNSAFTHCGLKMV